LAAGRAPVIISDDWCPPSGPDWDQIAVVWPERRIDELPRHLELIESEAEHRGHWRVQPTRSGTPWTSCSID